MLKCINKIIIRSFLSCRRVYHFHPCCQAPTFESASSPLVKHKHDICIASLSCDTVTRGNWRGGAPPPSAYTWPSFLNESGQDWSNPAKCDVHLIICLCKTEKKAWETVSSCLGKSGVQLVWPATSPGRQLSSRATHVKHNYHQICQSINKKKKKRKKKRDICVVNYQQ